MAADLSRFLKAQEQDYEQEALCNAAEEHGGRGILLLKQRVNSSCGFLL